MICRTPSEIKILNFVDSPGLENNPIKKARLTYFLVSSSLLFAIDKININAGYRTDHSSVEIEIILDTFNKGKGFWKFNNSLLRDKSFVDRVKGTMEQTLSTYCMNMNEEPRSRSYSIDKALLFEMMLMDIRAMTISFSIHKQRKKKTVTSLNTDNGMISDQYEILNIGLRQP